MSTPPINSSNDSKFNSSLGQLPPICKPVRPISEFLRDMVSGAVEGDFAKKQTLGTSIGQAGSGFIPIYGQIADARDTSAAINKVWKGEEGGWRALGLSLIAWIPGLGDVAKGAGRLRQRAVEQPADIFEEALVAKPRLFESTTVVERSEMPAGSGSTDKFGNISISSQGSKVDRALVLRHEQVHAALSPKFAILRELRADIGMTAYQKSSFLRYTEEALAETYAQMRVNGINGVIDGLTFPIQNGYVKLSDVVTEGAIGSVAVAGASYGVYVLSTNSIQSE